ncbi:uncharacterized protein LOC144003326 isoform X2 [Festucalex cinctus]
MCFVTECGEANTWSQSGAASQPGPMLVLSLTHSNALDNENAFLRQSSEIFGNDVTPGSCERSRPLNCIVCIATRLLLNTTAVPTIHLPPQDQQQIQNPPAQRAAAANRERKRAVAEAITSAAASEQEMADYEGTEVNVAVVELLTNTMFVNDVIPRTDQWCVSFSQCGESLCPKDVQLLVQRNEKQNHSRCYAL